MKQLIEEALALLEDISRAQADLMYQVGTWDSETKAAFILAYQLKYEKDEP